DFAPGMGATSAATQRRIWFGRASGARRRGGYAADSSLGGFGGSGGHPLARATLHASLSLPPVAPGRRRAGADPHGMLDSVGSELPLVATHRREFISPRLAAPRSAHQSPERRVESEDD